MNRYGDTPLGMVESALEFARIERDLDYHAFVFSMKSSNPKVMIAAYRGRRAGQSESLCGKSPVKFNIPEAEAVDRLKDLIREHGKWIESKTAVPVLV
jgi:4-hydroxy-3-methylbut-2-en-1-yl diphosphate synthase IspG/GcpE